jgi:hypothetical protein
MQEYDFALYVLHIIFILQFQECTLSVLNAIDSTKQWVQLLIVDYRQIFSIPIHLPSNPKSFCS